MARFLSREIITDSDDLESQSSDRELIPLQTKTKKHNPKKGTGLSKSNQTIKSASEHISVSGSRASESEIGAIEDAPELGSTCNNQAAPPASLTAKTFRPPRGFKAMPKTEAHSDISEVFSDLCGKQIWHITSPGSVPITSIQELAIDALAAGDPIMTLRGAEYRLREDKLAGNKHALLPGNGGNYYRRILGGVTHTFHVELVVHPPNGLYNYSPGKPISSTLHGLAETQRSQPENLRMRYIPFGTKPAPSQIIGSGSADSEMEQITFQIPGKSHADRKAKKRTRSKRDEGSPSQPRSDIEPIAVEKLSRKKSKKTHSLSPEHGPKFRHVEQNIPPQSPAEPREKENIERGRVEERDGHNFHRKSKKHKDGTSQQRRGRKEDRKLKKMEKQGKLVA